MWAIRAENLGKCYRLYPRPVDRLLELFLRKPRHRPFWALRNISFHLKKGETLGVIGDNGAGKSTLLKIIAGTLAPTEGHLACQGRVAALLELGAGFHPEFTGRQNIYLNAALLGLSEREIRDREEEIIAFAELEDFIDQPVKTYSSGMFVRLAFSIAVQVDPDILIVDEALSVGDQRFQKKSIDRICEFRKRGKTILFCSHSMYHVIHLCEKAIWLEQGRLKMFGEAKKVVQAYEDWCREKERFGASSEAETNNLGKVSFKLFSGTQRTKIFAPLSPLQVLIRYRAPERCHLAIGFKRNDNVLVFATSTQIDGFSPLDREGEMIFVLEKLPLLSGVYQVDVALLDETGNVVFARESEEIQVLKNHEEVGLVHLPHLWQKA